MSEIMCLHCQSICIRTDRISRLVVVPIVDVESKNTHNMRINVTESLPQTAKSKTCLFRISSPLILADECCDLIQSFPVLSGSSFCPMLCKGGQKIAKQAVEIRQGVHHP